MPSATSKLQSHAARFWAQVDRAAPEACWPWTGYCTETGYGRFKVGHLPMVASRVALELTIGDLGGLWVLHRCDNPPCCNPDHLFLGTHADNMADMHAKGRGPLRDGWGGRRCGENNPFAKLSDDQVRAIRRLSADGLKSPAIAGNFGVSPATVRDVLTGRGWSHVQ